MLYKNKLRHLRERNGLTQQFLAKKINLERDAYNHYENEDYLIPIKHLNTLCNYFKVSIDYIFEFNKILNYTDFKNEINKNISGQRLKELRKEYKITQDKLAQKLNISRTTIAEYERGTNLIATPFLYTICKEYKISADYLLGKIDSPKYLK